jgi:hypothetical protein
LTPPTGRPARVRSISSWTVVSLSSDSDSVPRWISPPRMSRLRMSALRNELLRTSLLSISDCAVAVAPPVTTAVAQMSATERPFAPREKRARTRAKELRMKYPLNECGLHFPCRPLVEPT